MSAIQQTTYQQLGEHNIYLFSLEKRSRGWLQVAVAVPDVPEGYLGVWVTDLDPRTDPLWGTEGTGSWLITEDNRRAELYTSEGRYEIGSDFNGNTFSGVGAPPSWLSTDPPPVPEPSLDELKITQLLTINNAFTEAAGALTTGYPEGERLTWPVQQSEALAWQLNSNAATPYLDGLAEARGITAEEMRQKTLDQTQLFMQASQALVGTRQRLRDQIDAATTPADVLVVVWVSPL